MPYLSIRTNMPLLPERQAALAAEASPLVAQLLGKPEKFVMIDVEADRVMRFGGTEEPLAYLSLTSLGLEESQCADLSAKLAQFIDNELGIPAARVYINFSAPPRTMFGWNATTFG